MITLIWFLQLWYVSSLFLELYKFCWLFFPQKTSFLYLWLSLLLLWVYFLFTLSYFLLVVTQILDLRHVLIYSVINFFLITPLTASHVFSVFIFIAFWPMDYLEVCILISTYSEIFLSAFCYSFPVKFHMVREHIMYDFNTCIFVEVCFVAKELIYLGKGSVGVWKKCILCCYWVWCSAYAR